MSESRSGRRQRCRVSDRRPGSASPVDGRAARFVESQASPAAEAGWRDVFPGATIDARPMSLREVFGGAHATAHGRRRSRRDERDASRPPGTATAREHSRRLVRFDLRRFRLLALLMRRRWRLPAPAFVEWAVHLVPTGDGRAVAGGTLGTREVVLVDARAVAGDRAGHGGRSCQADLPSDDRAFWRTRPIHAGRLALAKLRRCSCCLFVAVPSGRQRRTTARLRRAPVGDRRRRRCSSRCSPGHRGAGLGPCAGDAHAAALPPAPPRACRCRRATWPSAAVLVPGPTVCYGAAAAIMPAAGMTALRPRLAGNRGHARLVVRRRPSP